VFYFVLEALRTPNMVFSAISIATSFLAACLTVLRHPAYALAYAANDIVLIILWVLASRADLKYISVVVCFGAFLANDIYGFISWRKMKFRQSQGH
jgi:nicotinamide riboside transporter PnuC